MPTLHEYIVWGAVGMFGALPPEVIRAKSEDAAAEIYADMRGVVRDGRKIYVVRRKHVSDYAVKRIVEPA